MDPLLYEQTGDVARITFNRPDSLNALNEPLSLMLKERLEALHNDQSVKVVIMSGAGRAFSAGVDIKTTSAEGFQEGSTFMEVGMQIGELLSTLPQVSIAQVHGYCFTGALELMLMFDMAFCTESTQFGDTHAKWGIMPRWGMTQRLSRRVGLAKAKELTFRAYRVKGREAERIGLVNRAVPDGELEALVDQVVSDVLENSFEAIRAIKSLYDDGYATTLAAGLELEANANPNLTSTQDQLNQFKK